MSGDSCVCSLYCSSFIFTKCSIRKRGNNKSPTNSFNRETHSKSNSTKNESKTSIEPSCDLTKTRDKIQTENSNSTENDFSSFGLVKKGLRIANLNICHHLNKKDEIELLLSEKRSVDILGLCETFLNNDIPDELISIDGFNFERKDRKGKSGGGILVYISQLLNYKRREDIESGEIETIWLELLIPNSKSLLYCSGYRPPSAKTSWVENLAGEIDKASYGDNEIIISGDFNTDLMKIPPQFWSNALQEFNLTQVISSPTRVTDNSTTMIDHIYTNRPNNITEVNVPNISMSDHYPVCITRSTKSLDKKHSHITITYRDYKRFNASEYLADLACVNFDTLQVIDNPNIALEQFYKLLLPVLDKHAKIKTKRVKHQNSPKWMNSAIKEARHKRDLYHKKKDPENYRIWRNKVTELIREAKQTYYRKSIEENKNMSDIWRHLKEFNSSNNNKSPITHLTYQNSSADNPKGIANMYNDYITNIANSLKNDNQIPLETSKISEFVSSKIPLNTSFNFQYITDDEVLKLLLKLNVNKSAGIDNVGPRILKLSAPVVYKSIAYLVNLSIRQNIFPDKLKEAKITPIFKKGDKSTPGNYRPISILPTISKLFEKHMASQIREFINHFDLLQKEQSGFRQYHSCMTALTKMTDKWLSEIDKGNLTGTVFLDFSKAFDLVNHEILLKKTSVV